MVFKLSTDEMNQLKFDDEAGGNFGSPRAAPQAKPQTAKGLSFNHAMLDLDDVPVKRQPEELVNDGSSYGVQPEQTQPTEYNAPSFGRRELPITGPTPEQQAAYEAVPGSQPLGENGPKFQQSVDPETGQKQTFFVNTPENAEQSFGGSVRRAAQNSVLGAAKEAGGFVEWMADNTTGRVLGALLGADFENAANVNWFDENFPTVPASNDMERLGGELGSVAIGAATGTGLAKAADTAGGISKSVAQQYMRLFADEAKRLDPKNAQQKIEAASRVLFAEVGGASLGATITTPDNAGSLLQEWGVIPEEVPERIAVYADNVAGAAIIGSAVKVLGLGTKAAWEKFGAGLFKDRSNPTTVLREQLMAIDPGLQGASEEELVKRLEIMSRVLGENSSLDAGRMGELPLQPSSAMNLGAKQYVAEAYGFMQQNMSPEQWDAYVNERAGQIANKVGSLRDSLRSNVTVQGMEGRVNAAADGALSSQAASYANPNQIAEAGGNLGKLAMKDRDEAAKFVDPFHESLAQADELVRETQRSGPIMGTISDVRKNNPLGDTGPEEAQMNQIFGPTLLNAQNQSYNQFKQAYAAIPEGLPFNEMVMANKLYDIGKFDKNVLNAIGAKAPSDLISEFGTVMDDAGNDITIETIAKSLEGMDLKTLYTKVRPALAQSLDAMKKNPTPGQNETQYVELKNFIDDLAEQSGDESFQRAKNLYIDHENTYGNLDMLKQLDEEGRRVNNSTIGKGRENFLVNARRAVDAAMSENTGIELKSLLDAAQEFSTQDITADTGMAQMAIILKGLARNSVGTGSVSAQELVNAMSPQSLAKLKSMVPEQAEQYEEAVRQVLGAEQGQKGAELALEQAETVAKGLISEVERSAAFKFVQNASEGTVVRDPEVVFDKIFKDANQSHELITRAKASGDETIINGMKSHYLRYLRDNIFTSKPQSMTGDGGFTFDSSFSTLNKINNSHSDQTWKIFEDLFEDEPGMIEDMQYFLTGVELDLGGRATRPAVFGSNTTVNNERQQAIQSLVRIFVGPLNRTGTTINSVTSAFTKADVELKREAVASLMGRLITDTKFLTQSIDEIVAAADKKPILERIGRGAGVGSGNFIRSSIMNLRPETTPDPIDRETEEAFGPPQRSDVEGASPLQP